MNNATHKLLAGLLVLLLCGGLIAAKVPNEPKQYDYITIVQSWDEVRISGNQRPFEKLKIKKTGELDANFEELLRKVSEFEAQGYELIENNVYTHGNSIMPYNYVLLRKPRS